MRLPMAAALSD